MKEGIHLFNYEIGNKFFKNFDYYDFLDAKLFAKLELEKQSTLLNLKFSFNGEIEVQCDVSMESFDLKLETEHAVVVKFKDDIMSSSTLILSDISNTHQLGLVMYTDYILYFQLAGVVLLLAMIGAILLTFRQREGVKKQSYINQVTRSPLTAVELVEVKSNQGVKIDD